MIIKPYDSIRIYTDGGARGNPGPSAIGYVILDEDREPIYQNAKFIGSGTNNEAEYKALIRALKRAKKYTEGYVLCYSDSQLMVNQLNDLWKVKDKKLKPLFNKIIKLADYFDEVKIVHVRRSDPMITLADKLLNAALNAELYSSKREKKA
jgi:ribonuclease HI